MLDERIRQALDVLGSDGHVGGTLREQASTYLGESVDDQSLQYMCTTAETTYEHTLGQAIRLGYPEDQCLLVAIVNVLIAGMALGKRLGIEDGERFAREIGSPE